MGVDDCLGVEDGDYQSPDGCKYYVTCANNVISRKRRCNLDDEDGKGGAIVLEWDDKLKKCVFYSETCPEDPHTPKPTQHETDPTKATRPTQHETDPTKPPRPTQHETDPTRPTQHETDPTKPPRPTQHETDPATKGTTVTEGPNPTPRPTCGPDDCDPCITDCYGKPVTKGKYQTCSGCQKYATCEHGKFTEILCCEEREWDDNLKICVEAGKSTTCPWKGKRN